MAKFWDEFKTFAMKGNFFDMAIGVVVGGAFGKIVTSLVNDILMPLIGWAVGGVDLSSLKVPLKGTLAGNMMEQTSKVIGSNSDVIEKVSGYMAKDVPEVAYLRYGNFIQEVFHCCPEKFYHKVSCLTEPSSGTSMGTSGLL